MSFNNKALVKLNRTSKFIRSLSTSSFPSNVTLPKLPYAYDALEPVIPKEIMILHHTKHHAAYIANFKKSVEEHQKAFESKNVEKMKAIEFNAGGHVNHSIFWQNLSPSSLYGGKIEQAEKLKIALCTRFGSINEFISKISAATVAIQGSGWGWLVYEKGVGISIKTTQNQDMVSVAHKNCVPLLGIDVWEHAYYLKYENRRPEYLSEIWKVVNWNDVEQRFNAAIKL